MESIERIFEMPRKWTFEQPKLRDWVVSWCRGRVLNLFSGPTKLGLGEVTNDINEDIPADYHVDALKFSETPGIGLFDTIIMDPPYSMYQAIKTYGNERLQDITQVRRQAEKLLTPNGRVISLGYNSTGMSASRGFKRQAILLCNNGGSHNDIIVTVEDKTT